MRRFHFTLAWLVLSAFSVTGMYMHVAHGHLRDTDLALAAFWRSRHIYLLLLGITLLALGIYAQPVPGRRWMQYLGSAVLGCSAIAITIAFFVEADSPRLRSPLSGWAIQALIPAMLLHLIAGGRRAGRVPSTAAD